MARGVSTVLDVSVCLLLVGVAVATVAVGLPVGESEGPSADSTARTVGTATEAVPTASGRRVHDTLAGHIGRAAVVNGSLGGQRMAETAYPEAVQSAVGSSTGHRVFVTSWWEPYPDAPISGSVVAGTEPPRDADIALTTLTVDSGIRAPRNATTFDGLANELAAGYVERLFPPERTRALLVDGRTAPTVSTRYRQAGDTLDVAVGADVANVSVRNANKALVSELAARLRADLRERYASPETAHRNLTVGTVKIAVRRWDP